VSVHVVEGSGPVPSRCQVDTFQRLASDCASLLVERVSPVGACTFRATRLSLVGDVIDRVLVYPDGEVYRDPGSRRVA
jgi:hypothetical protein